MQSTQSHGRVVSAAGHEFQSPAGPGVVEGSTPTKIGDASVEEFSQDDVTMFKLKIIWRDCVHIFGGRMSLVKCQQYSHVFGSASVGDMGKCFKCGMGRGFESSPEPEEPFRQKGVTHLSNSCREGCQCEFALYEPVTWGHLEADQGQGQLDDTLQPEWVQGNPCHPSIPNAPQPSRKGLSVTAIWNLIRFS